MYFCRPERAHDVDAIRVVLETAFPSPAEARLVDALRANGRLTLSMVASDGAGVIGHVAFSPVEAGTATGLGLAPMAVLPEHQRDGIGARLVEEGIVRLQRSGCPFVIVLGHPGYYPRFGFERASAHAIECQWPVPDDAFMIRILDPAAMAGATGIARYRPEFDAVV